MTLDARIVAVVPAAGESRRFGAHKLSADVGGVALIDRTVASLLDGGVARVIVVARVEARFAGAQRLEDPRVTVIVNPDPARGMFSSIQAGLAAADADVVLVLPGDMPFVASATVTAVAGRAAATGSVVVPVHRERRGHPIALPRRCVDALLALPSATTLKEGLTALGAVPLPLEVDDPGVLRDVDVPADLQPTPRDRGR